MGRERIGCDRTRQNTIRKDAIGCDRITEYDRRRCNRMR